MYRLLLVIHNRDPKEVLHQIERITHQLRRCSSTTTLCTASTEPPVFVEQQLGLSAGMYSIYLCFRFRVSFIIYEKSGWHFVF